MNDMPFVLIVTFTLILCAMLLFYLGYLMVRDIRCKHEKMQDLHIKSCSCCGKEFYKEIK